MEPQSFSFWTCKKILFLKQKKGDNFCNVYLEKLFPPGSRFYNTPVDIFLEKPQSITITVPKIDRVCGDMCLQTHDDYAFIFRGGRAVHGMCYNSFAGRVREQLEAATPEEKASR